MKHRQKMGRIGIILGVILLIIGNFMIFGSSDNLVQKQKLSSENTKTAYFAGGCFWCMEKIFEKQTGVFAVYSGYTGGDESTATYEKTSAGGTGHREAIRIVYNPEQISFETLVELYWTQIDPTDGEGQFNDRGFVYSPAIYYSNSQEKLIAENSKEQLQNSGKFQDTIAVPIIPATAFFDAEEYHQDYYKKNPLRYGYYYSGSGRKDFIEENWAETIQEIESSLPQGEIQQPYGEVELREKLSPLQYKVTQEDGTEPPFQNEYWDNKEAGIYVDIIDGTPLYSSLDKFDSGTGWPSFTKAISEENLKVSTDTRFFMTRTEVSSSTSGAHLGHIFEDAPVELGGIRHCINSAALRFIPVEDLEREGYGEYLEMFE